MVSSLRKNCKNRWMQKTKEREKLVLRNIFASSSLSVKLHSWVRRPLVSYMFIIVVVVFVVLVCIRWWSIAVIRFITCFLFFVFCCRFSVIRFRFFVFIAKNFSVHLKQHKMYFCHEDDIDFNGEFVFVTHGHMCICIGVGNVGSCALVSLRCLRWLRWQHYQMWQHQAWLFLYRKW